jgi:hypothetical protein
MQAANGEAMLQQVFPGWLTDLDPDGVVPPNITTGAFDSAKAKLKVVESSDGTSTFSLEVRGIDPSFDGRTFGSHLHTASCTAGTPLAGPHYTKPGWQLGLPLEEWEVWFTVTPENGKAFDQTEVDHVPKDQGPPDGGIMSIVIHTGTTNPDTGLAGPREVCLPLATTWG